jgi:hypothetical protein
MIEVMSLGSSGVDKARRDPTARETLWVRMPPNIWNNAFHCGFLGSKFHSSDKWQYSGLMTPGSNFASMGGAPVIKSWVEGLGANHLSTPLLV